MCAIGVVPFFFGLPWSKAGFACPHHRRILGFGCLSVSRDKGRGLTRSSRVLVRRTQGSPETKGSLSSCFDRAGSSLALTGSMSRRSSDRQWGRKAICSSILIRLRLPRAAGSLLVCRLCHILPSLWPESLESHLPGCLCFEMVQHHTAVVFCPQCL